MSAPRRTPRVDAYPRTTTGRDNTWRGRANCAGEDTERWFTAKGARLDPAARELCRTCPVRAECAEYAITTGQQHGWWGGLSPDELRAIRRRRGLKPQRRPTTYPDVCGEYCGTETGYSRHLRAQDTPCRSCRQAHTRKTGGSA